MLCYPLLCVHMDRLLTTTTTMLRATLNSSLKCSHRIDKVKVGFCFIILSPWLLYLLHLLQYERICTSWETAKLKRIKRNLIIFHNFYSPLDVQWIIKMAQGAEKSNSIISESWIIFLSRLNLLEKKLSLKKIWIGKMRKFLKKLKRKCVRWKKAYTKALKRTFAKLFKLLQNQFSWWENWKFFILFKNNFP